MHANRNAHVCKNKTHAKKVHSSIILLDEISIAQKSTLPKWKNEVIFIKS